MKLDRDACEYLLVTIAAKYADGTDVPLDAWEASFDKKETWLPAEIVTVAAEPAGDFAAWLLAGPDASEQDQTEADLVLTANTDYHLRLVDNPETVIRKGGVVRLVTP